MGTLRWTVDEFALCLVYIVESWWVMVASAEAALEAWKRVAGQLAAARTRRGARSARGCRSTEAS